MTIERKRGGYEIYSMVDGYLFTMFYMGYTRKEAIAQYRYDRRIEKRRNINEVK